jgi:hypothetical protein
MYNIMNRGMLVIKDTCLKGHFIVIIISFIKR